MSKFWRNRRLISSILGELGCGLVTVIVFTLPLWVFSAAARGPRFAAVILVGLIAVLAALAIFGRLVRRR